MYQQTKQVAFTYLTNRWIWFVIVLTTLLMLPSTFEKQTIGVALGLPAMMGLTFLTAIVKWQFVHPRAQLMPAHRPTHLAVLAMILLAFFVALPLAMAAYHDINPLGPLAYALTLCACVLFSLLLNYGPFMFVALGIFISTMNPTSYGFWFEGLAPTLPIHACLILIGLAMLAICFRHLVLLNEEMDGYQTMPIGGLQYSRVERAEQRKILGNKLKQRKLLARLADFWLDRCLKISTRSNLFALRSLGLSSTPTWLIGILTGLGFVAYAYVADRVGFLGHDEPGQPPSILIVFAQIIPIAGSGMALMQHRPRIAQELLRPDSRQQYFRELLKVVAARNLLLWLGIHIGLGCLCYVLGSYPRENTMVVVATYIAISLALQILMFGISIRIGLLTSHLIYVFAMYPIVAVQMLVLNAWWTDRDTWAPSHTLGLLLASIVLGGCLFAWAKRCWIEAEMA